MDKARETIPIGVYLWADEAAVALSVDESESVGRGQQREGADDGGGREEHG